MTNQHDPQKERARRASDPAQAKYREHLLACEQKSQESYDKTLLTLSGGALAISFAFVENFIAKRPIENAGTLTAAWVCWAGSLALLLASFYISVFAFRRTLMDFDDGHPMKEPGGTSGYWVDALNAVGGILFIAGLILMFIFVHNNLGR